LPAASVTSEFKIDPELESLIPPLADGEYAELKDGISREECREPLTIWKGHGIILDGHNRYQICKKLQVPFKTVEIELPDLTAAKIWIIKNQRGRSNLDESQWAMLAVKLEALYAEEAKERKGSRTDLGQNLGQGEFGRSAEKAAKDMGVSHQTVSYAKQVSTKGIPELVKLVESGNASVSAAAKVTSLAPKTQTKIVEKAQTLLKEGTRPNIPALIREIVPKTARNNPDELLDKTRTNLQAGLELLEGIEETQRPENLVEMQAMVEKIMARLKEIEMKCLDPKIGSQSTCVIDLKHFRTFIESIAPISNEANLKFDSDGARIRALNPSANAMVDAFLPRELFSHYAEIGKIGLPDTEKLRRMLTILSDKSSPGKANLRIYVEPGKDNEHPDQLHMISGPDEMVYLLQNPIVVDAGEFPESISTCKVHIEGKNLAEAIKQSSAFGKTSNTTSTMSKTAKFSVSEKLFRIVSEDETHDKGIAKPHCEVLGDESADSLFDLDQLLAIKHTIEKSKDVTLSLGMGQPMILDLDINKISIKYHVAEKEPMNALQRGN
jgi:ParB-like chromosome segregation protein Spo0J